MPNTLYRVLALMLAVATASRQWVERCSPLLVAAMEGGVMVTVKRFCALVGLSIGGELTVDSVSAAVGYSIYAV